MKQQTITWPFAGCEVREYPSQGANGYLETVWPDGAVCPATRDHTMENVAYARHLGYASVRDALREHELLHAFAAEKLGYPYSPTLRAVALAFAPGTAPYERQLGEEALVLEWQRYMNTGEVGPVLSPYAWRLAEWTAEFRQRFCPPRGIRGTASDQ